MKNLSNWRSVRLWETSLQKELRSRHTLWLHGLCIGTLVLAMMWATSHLQMALGSDSLALRYLVTLGAGYLFYLLVLRLWAGSMVGRDKDGPTGDGVGVRDEGGSTDLSLPDVSWESGQGGMQSGGGGDFGGGGATGDFSGAGDIASGALDVAAGADEGAIVVVPVVAVFLVGCAVVFGAGSLMLLYFGWDALLTVAVELAFSYVSARTAVRVVREGWLSAAIRLTWKPLLGALACAVLLGGTLDFFVPSAHSLPHAIQLMKLAK
jgi:hypothetical protein